MKTIRLGSIYVITNINNGKRYVGQTSRDIETRFSEHIWETRGNSYLHNAIQAEGAQNFKIELIEQVPLEQLDDRERYWIKEYNTCDKNKGYNIAPGGKGYVSTYNHVMVVENNLVFDSLEEMGRIMSTLTSWSLEFIKDKFRAIIDTDKDFLTYHFKSVPYTEFSPSDPDVLEDWIKTLNIRFQGKHIYCIELDRDFETVGQAAKYLLDNDLYTSQSKAPVQSLISSIGQHLHGKHTCIKDLRQRTYHFEELPGPGTKSPGAKNAFVKKKVYCPELDKTFESMAEAGNYFINNNIWRGITVKTARLRISDVVRGVFPDYRGYTFQEVE